MIEKNFVIRAVSTAKGVIFEIMEVQLAPRASFACDAKISK